MSDIDWDEDGFEPPVQRATKNDLWEGEDEDAEVLDNWDDEKDEDEKPTDNGEPTTATQAKKKKTLKEKIAEREQKKRLELEEKKKEQELEETSRDLSPEEMAAEKARQLKLQEESDLLLAMETFGVNKDGTGGQIDTFIASTKEDFDKFEEILREKISKFDKSPHYVPFLENLFRQLSLDLEAEDIKRLGSTLTALSNEKAKQQKGTKGKKKKTKASLVMGKDTKDDMYAETGGYDEYDDFL